MKNVPGKKTDMRASEWISTLLRAGLLNGSFIAEKRIREFRNFLGGLTIYGGKNCIAPNES